MLSIIIPTLNEQDYLPLLLKSIKRQNFNGGYEIIVADADSKDKTVKVAKEYGCKTVSGGLPSKGRNNGAKNAKGNLFLFLDADTSLPPNFLENIIKEFKARELGTASFPIYSKGNRFDKIAHQFYNSWVKLTQNFLPHATQAILIKKEIHKEIKGFDETIKIGEDHDYARRAAKFGKFGLLSYAFFSSSRRLERDGRIKTYFKYVLAGAYILILGPVKSDIFKYKFNHYKKNSSNEPGAR